MRYILPHYRLRCHRLTLQKPYAFLTYKQELNYENAKVVYYSAVAKQGYTPPAQYYATDVQLDGADSVIIRRDGIFNHTGIAVRVNGCNTGDMQFAGFRTGDYFFLST